MRMMTILDIKIEIGIDLGNDIDIIVMHRSFKFRSWQSSWRNMSFPFSLVHSMLKPTSSLRNEVVLH